MRRTVRRVMETWKWEDTWGWNREGDVRRAQWRTGAGVKVVARHSEEPFTRTGTLSARKTDRYLPGKRRSALGLAMMGMADRSGHDAPGFPRTEMARAARRLATWL